ncbi:MAG: DUF3500 domain-containing protein [Verrucomicrobiales bacterium]|nr:DUF3500 domain-containing protein [Verrucomicrobiales bacterium]
MKFTLTLLAIAAMVLPASAHDVATSMADAASDFLSNLTEEQKAKATYKLEDPARKNWHFIPKPFEGEEKRIGLPLKEMRPDQKHLAYALLSTGLSHKGFTTALQIMSLEQVLWELEQAPKRDTSMYYLTIFGTPGEKNWGWKVEGHHISMNFTIADGDVIAGTPVFFASNPAEVLEGPRKGLRVLAAEEDVARSLAKSLTDEQKAEAVIMDKAPRDILTSAEQKVNPLEGGGLAYGKLDESQKTQLHQLIDVYIRRLREGVANDEWKQIKAAGLDKVVFAWAGGYEKNEPHYYRVQGPTFLLEYANTQNGANHVHAVWRDFDGDFGEDLLRKHYAEYHREER